MCFANFAGIFDLKSGSKNRPNNIAVSEVCGNLFSKTPENVVLFGFFEFITFSGSIQNLESDLEIEISVNNKPLKRKYLNFKTEDQNLHFHAYIPVGELIGETGYLVGFSVNNKIVSQFMINMAGPMPDHLEEKELHNYLKNQIWYYHRLIVEKNKRVWALENSLSWRLTRPFRSFFEILQKLPLVFSKGGFQYLLTLLKDGGATQLRSNLRQVIKTDDLTAAYQHYINRKKWEELAPHEIKKAIAELKQQPLISIITPVYNCPKNYLEDCINSVLDQSYPNWELCIYDDASNNAETLDTLKKYAEEDKRIKVVFGEKNLHISEASNQAAANASGEFIALLDHDDLLHKHALFEVVNFLKAHPQIDMVYSDEDKLNKDGLFTEPYFKSDFNEALFLSNNYLNHFTVIRKAIFQKVKGFRKGYEGSQDYDLFLRIFSVTKNIGHIPKVLYHWRKVPGSTAENYQAKSYPEQASEKALNDFLKREKIDGTVEKGFYPGSFRIKSKIKHNHKVSIIIPFKDQVELLKKCLKSLHKTIGHLNHEIILVNNQSEEQNTIDFLAKTTSYKVINYDDIFNYSAINNAAAKEATGDILLFLNNDIEAIEKGWFEAMLEHFEKEEVGAVGAKLSYPDFTLQHAGVILGINGVASHGHKHLPSNSPGYFMRANTIQYLSACTAACLMVRKSIFEKVNGFDADNLKIAFNDIDLCLKIRALDFKIVYTPFAHLIHHESKSRGFEDSPEKIRRFENEIAFMQKKWGKTLKDDPYYNPNLTLHKEDFSLKI